MERARNLCTALATLSPLAIGFMSLGWCPMAMSQSITALEDGLDTWKPLQIDFTSSQSYTETGSTNPFMDRRLDVTFELLNDAGQPTGTTYVVPGFFNADGQAAQSHATGGNQWSVRFTPSQPGTWRYTTSFRQGTDVAVSDNPLAGSAGDAAIHAKTGSFTVAARDTNAPGFLSKGRLTYTGNHYLQTLGDGKYWIKGGTDSPENLLGYLGFDNTASQNNKGPDNRVSNTSLSSNALGRLHQYHTHRDDWEAGDPNWSRNPSEITNLPAGRFADGKGLVGSLNYLASQQINSIYFLPMNLGGDAQDSYPLLTQAPLKKCNTMSPNSNNGKWLSPMPSDLASTCMLCSMRLKKPISNTSTMQSLTASGSFITGNWWPVSVITTRCNGTSARNTTVTLIWARTGSTALPTTSTPSMPMTTPPPFTTATMP
ncbi:MAG: DUF5060 domain-containing protein [Phycisphaerales bacterium]|nr:DUF5060 domain-containing protein [Phycisphaerales bacterium]